MSAVRNIPLRAVFVGARQEQLSEVVLRNDVRLGVLATEVTVVVQVRSDVWVSEERHTRSYRSTCAAKRAVLARSKGAVDVRTLRRHRRWLFRARSGLGIPVLR